MMCVRRQGETRSQKRIRIPERQRWLPESLEKHTTKKTNDEKSASMGGALAFHREKDINRPIVEAAMQ